MVFEHLAAFFIDKFLGNYIEDFDSHQLKLNLWHGLFSLERYSFPMNEWISSFRQYYTWKCLFKKQCFGKWLKSFSNLYYIF